jgi:hypothetical protein
MIRMMEAMEVGLRPIGAGPTPRRELGMRNVEKKRKSEMRRFLEDSKRIEVEDPPFSGWIKVHIKTRFVEFVWNVRSFPLSFHL